MNRISKLSGTKLVSAAAILAVIFGGLVAQSVRAVGSNPAPVCVGANCTVTFEATGDYYRWAPPAFAANVGFDLYGAQGGRGGGLGGRVAGTFSAVPAEILIYVGGLGQTGNGAPGGFNGGGQAGMGAGDEGSGGGATDIRSTVNIADRLVVAAGGGGSGGLNGASGGSGGTAQGNQGNSGQGQGGFGASTSAPGYGGYPNGGSWGSNGSGAVGGAGGSSYLAGGGGGGGGYFGGGGGGADIDPCCQNGAGGGGGSSWNNAAVTSLSQNTKGVQAGAGKAILSYQMPPEVSFFNADSALTNADSVGFNLGFSQTVTGLDAADFSLDVGSPACSSTTVTGSGTSYRIVLAGCADGTLRLRLRADAVLGALAGPKVAKAATEITLDRLAPTVALTGGSGVTNATTLEYRLTTSEPLVGLTAADFAVTGTGCVVQAPTNQGEFFTVRVASCASGANVVLTMAAGSATDVAGNAAPPSALVSESSLTDTLPAVLTISAPASPSNLAGLQFRVATSEPIFGLTLQDFEADGQGCALTDLTTEANDFLITVGGCSDSALVALAIKPGAVTDVAGNSSPVARQASAQVQIDRVGPSVSFGLVPEVSNAQLLEFALTLSEPALDFEIGDLAVLGQGCQIDALTGDALDYRIAVSGCADGVRATVSVTAASMSDSLANLGPLENAVSSAVLIDRTAPTPSWVATLVGSRFDAVDFDLIFAESVSGLALTDFLLVGSAANCNLTMHEVESSRSFLFHLTGCSLGSVQLASASAAFTDLSGNPGQALLSPVATLALPGPTPSTSVVATPSSPPSQPEPVAPVAPQPVPVAPAPAPVPVVQAPEPQPEVVVAPPVVQEPVIQPTPVSESTQVPEPTQVPEATPVPEPTQQIPEPIGESTAEPMVAVALPAAPARAHAQVSPLRADAPNETVDRVITEEQKTLEPIAEPIVAADEIEDPATDDLPIVYLAVGALAGTALGVGIAKALRARRIRPGKRLQRLYA